MARAVARASQARERRLGPRPCEPRGGSPGSVCRRPQNQVLGRLPGILLAPVLPVALPVIPRLSNAPPGSARSESRFSKAPRHAGTTTRRFEPGMTDPGRPVGSGLFEWCGAAGVGMAGAPWLRLEGGERSIGRIVRGGGRESRRRNASPGHGFPPARWQRRPNGRCILRLGRVSTRFHADPGTSEGVT